MRLGVSPAAAPTPTGVLNQRFEALFPCAGALGCVVSFAPPPVLLVFLCTNVGPYCLPRSTISHLAGSTSCCLALSPVHPSCPSPPLLPVWMNVSLSPWLLDFHAVRFSVSSGCFLFLSCCCPSFGCARRWQCVHLLLHLGRELPSLTFFFLNLIPVPLIS